LYGYYGLLELKRNPPHPTSKKDADAREMLEWLGEWDSELVDLAEINQMLGRVRVKKAFKCEPLVREPPAKKSKKTRVKAVERHEKAPKPDRLGA